MTNDSCRDQLAAYKAEKTKKKFKLEVRKEDRKRKREALLVARSEAKHLRRRQKYLLLFGHHLIF